MSSDHVSFSVARERLQEFYEKFVPTKRQECINPFCVKETENALLYVWEYGRCAYEHSDRRHALNITTMVVNGKQHWAQSPYCCECFKRHVLVGDNKKVSQHYGDYLDGCEQVNVTFSPDPCPSTWFNERTQRVECLSKYQEAALSGTFDLTDMSRYDEPVDPVDDSVYDEHDDPVDMSLYE